MLKISVLIDTDVSLKRYKNSLCSNIQFVMDNLKMEMKWTKQNIHSLINITLMSIICSSRGGGAKVIKSINEEVGINVEGGSFWKNST